MINLDYSLPPDVYYIVKHKNWVNKTGATYMIMYPVRNRHRKVDIHNEYFAKQHGKSTHFYIVIDGGIVD